MLSGLLRPKQGRQDSEQQTPRFRGIQAFRTDTPSREEEEEEEEEDDEQGDYDEEEFEDGEPEQEQDDNEDEDEQPVLPIFSIPVLDKIPVYHLQHSIRLLVVQKCETTLSWDQLRSPQISQFLVKPIAQRIREEHLSSGTLYALLANCLQFQKDGQLSPGSVGVCRTRAILCELLAMRLMKESSTRELIDALFYDFDPLQGFAYPTNGTPTTRARGNNTRISTVEIAIRAQAKRFLAHPLVVQQLEAIWAGTIVFHSAADTLHRRPQKRSLYTVKSYGTMQTLEPPVTVMRDQNGNGKTRQMEVEPILRRSVSLYDPSDASPFKLSRLRVPRYRQLFSTLSYAVMLALFVAVLVEHSLYITPLELVFWFWSAGYMLDEIVGFTEQGFGLYILSVWNAFDIGILFMLVVYYCFRLYGILMPMTGKHHTANLAYDVLASTAVLLFPRLFSVLDHYRYFSQLMIAFRMMALDLVAILILILIACSGFFVAFTLSFAVDLSPGAAAYALFQILMGFTPAAWEIWDGYNLLGKAVLTLFLIICHFLIVTILITVLTNSFMAVVQNANEEHQFLFAVNTISMVKSDALFSYIAPANIFGWMCTPLRYVLPFRTFVKLNRWIIKLTHLPLLLSICMYERLILARRVYEPTDLVERRGRRKSKLPAVFALAKDLELFSPEARLREPSVTTYHKDRALEEVFRRPFRDLSATKEHLDKKTNVVHDWMQGMGRDGGAGSPMEQDRQVLDRLETRRPNLKRNRFSQGVVQRRASFLAPSAFSDPEDNSRFLRPGPYKTQRGPLRDLSMEDIPQQTEDDAGDELATNDDDDHRTDDPPSMEDLRRQSQLDESFAEQDEPEEEDFQTPIQPPLPASAFKTAATSRQHSDISEEPSPTRLADAHKRKLHDRTTSSGTILYSPLHSTGQAPESSPPKRTSSPKRKVAPSTQPSHGTRSGTATPGRLLKIPAGLTSLATTTSTSTGTPPQPPPSSSTKPRPILPPKSARQSQRNLTSFLALERRRAADRDRNWDTHRDWDRARDPSLSARALDLASDLGDNRAAPTPNILEALPASFGTTFEMAAAAAAARRGGGGAGWRGAADASWRRAGERDRERGNRGAAAAADEDDDEDEEEEEEGEGDRRLNRLVLARMETLELGFREVLREVKGWNLSRAGSVEGESRMGLSGGMRSPFALAGQGGASASASASGGGGGGGRGGGGGSIGGGGGNTGGAVTSAVSTPAPQRDKDRDREKEKQK